MEKQKNINFYDLLIFLSVFIVSLEDYGNSRLFLVIPLILISICVSFYYNINKSNVFCAFKVIAVILFISIISYFEIAPFKQNMGSYGVFDFWSAMTLKVILVSFVFFFKSSYDKFHHILAITLKVHVCVFIFQLISVYLTGYYPELLEPFTGEASRYTWGVHLPIIGETFRPTGFFNEPSKYFAMIFPILVIRYIISRKLEGIDKLAILTFLMTLSLAAIPITALFLFLVYAKKKDFVKYGILVLILIAIMSPFFLDLVQTRSSGSYDPMLIRVNLFNAVFYNQDLPSLLLGNGPVGVPEEISYLYEKDISSWTSEGYAASNDIGLFFYFITKFGIFGLIAVILHVYGYTKESRITLIILLILLTKIKMTSVLFVLVVLFFLINKKENSNSHD